MRYHRVSLLMLVCYHYHLDAIANDSTTIITTTYPGAIANPLHYRRAGPAGLRTHASEDFANRAVHAAPRDLDLPWVH